MSWLDRLFEKPAARNVYAGAQNNRLTADWVFAPVTSADQEVKADMRTLRARARDLVRNNGHAARYVDLVAEGVVGPNGFTLQSRATLANGEPDRNVNDAVESSWHEWCRPEYASADGRLSFCDIETLTARSEPQDGEILIRMLPGFPNKFGFALQVLDPDQLDQDFNREPTKGSTEVRMGVEIDGWSRPLAYWIWSAHPSEPGRKERVRVPADQMIHLYMVKRPGMTRGPSWFAPVMFDVRMLGAYQEASVVAARMGASQMGFITQDPESITDPNAPSATLAPTIEAEPGRFTKLPPGYGVTPFNPEQPSGEFPAFTKAMLRSIAAGLKVSYNSLTGDLEAVNYSSIRAGLLVERDVWRGLQQRMITHVHSRIYREWKKWAVISGALQIPITKLSRADSVQWQARGFDWVDPLKDLEAAALSINLGLDSRKRLAAERGRDFEEILIDQSAEQKLAAEYGVTLQSEPKPKATNNGKEDTDEAADDASSDDDRARPRFAVVAG
jgi:lambda family phage portal protein